MRGWVAQTIAKVWKKWTRSRGGLQTLTFPAVGLEADVRDIPGLYLNGPEKRSWRALIKRPICKPRTEPIRACRCIGDSRASRPTTTSSTAPD